MSGAQTVWGLRTDWPYWRDLGCVRQRFRRPRGSFSSVNGWLPRKNSIRGTPSWCVLFDFSNLECLLSLFYSFPSIPSFLFLPLSKPFLSASLLWKRKWMKESEGDSPASVTMSNDAFWVVINNTSRMTNDKDTTLDAHWPRSLDEKKKSVTLSAGSWWGVFWRGNFVGKGASWPFLAHRLKQRTT